MLSGLYYGDVRTIRVNGHILFHESLLLGVVIPFECPKRELFNEAIISTISQDEYSFDCISVMDIVNEN